MHKDLLYNLHANSVDPIKLENVTPAHVYFNGIILNVSLKYMYISARKIIASSDPVNYAIKMCQKQAKYCWLQPSCYM